MDRHAPLALVVTMLSCAIRFVVKLPRQAAARRPLPRRTLLAPTAHAVPSRAVAAAAAGTGTQGAAAVAVAAAVAAGTPVDAGAVAAAGMAAGAGAGPHSQRGPGGTAAGVPAGDHRPWVAAAGGWRAAVPWGTGPSCPGSTECARPSWWATTPRSACRAACRTTASTARGSRPGPTAGPGCGGSSSAGVRQSSCRTCVGTCTPWTDTRPAGTAGTKGSPGCCPGPFAPWPPRRATPSRGTGSCPRRRP
mmetsp:Transcript_50558/g.126746  ORF Transcript_50558/g.126746 Transcript_50558/m.126746 type:complete len:249 (-) Transcript_50558:947-1693(-)